MDVSAGATWIEASGTSEAFGRDPWADRARSARISRPNICPAHSIEC